MLHLLLNYVVCGRLFEFMLKNMFKIKINVRNEIPMSELVKIELLFVKIAPQMKNFCSVETDGGHFLKRCFSGLTPQNREGHRSSFFR